MRGKSRKHKKDKYYRQNSNAYRDPSRAMMSGDSPARDSLLELKERVAGAGAAAAAGATVNASVLVEPVPGQGNIAAAASAVASTPANTTASTVDDEAIETVNTPLAPRKDSGVEHAIGNGSIAGVDGVDAKLNEEAVADEDEDNCTVKCLYYTMQCCECSLM